MNLNTAHLTDDQIDDALIGGLGDLDQECAEHLASCDACQERLAETNAPIASFNAVTLAWSERQSATLPVASARPAWLPKAAWAATAAAVLAVGVAVPLTRHEAAERTLAANHAPAETTLMAATGPVENPVAARAEQIARDNQMLENIDREVDAPTASPQEYGLLTSAHAGSAASASVRN